MPSEISQRATPATAEILQDPTYQSLKGEAIEHNQRTAAWGAGGVIGTLGTAGAIILGTAAAATPLLIGSAVVVGVASAGLLAVSAVKGLKARIDAKAANQQVALYVDKLNEDTPATVPEQEYQKPQQDLQSAQAPANTVSAPIAVAGVETDPLSKLLANARRELGRDDDSNAYYDLVVSARQNTVLAEVNDYLQPQGEEKVLATTRISRSGK